MRDIVRIGHTHLHTKRQRFCSIKVSWQTGAKRTVPFYVCKNHTAYEEHYTMNLRDTK